LVENNNLLNLLSELDLLEKFSLDVELDTHALVVEIKSLFDSLPQVQAVNIETLQQMTAEVPVNNPSCSTSTSLTMVSKDCVVVPYPDMAITPSRLPVIHLPYFDGEFKNWPVFWDRLNALVDQRSNIPNLDMLSLCCLRADPQDVIKGITVSNDTYSLPWNT